MNKIKIKKKKKLVQALSPIKLFMVRFKISRGPVAWK
jgi:hypothetical protein